MSRPAAHLTTIDGRLSVVVDAEHARQLHVLLGEALDRACARGSGLLPAVREIAEVCRYAAAAHTFGIVPVEGQMRDGVDVVAESWISTAEMARHLGISHDAVRKRVARGAMCSRLVAGRRLVRLNGESDARTSYPRQAEVGGQRV